MTRTSSSSASSAPSRFDLREIYRPIERELATATETLRARLGGGDATLDGYLAYTFQLGGKHNLLGGKQPENGGAHAVIAAFAGKRLRGGSDAIAFVAITTIIAALALTRASWSTLY